MKAEDAIKKYELIKTKLENSENADTNQASVNIENKKSIFAERNFACYRTKSTDHNCAPV